MIGEAWSDKKVVEEAKRILDHSDRERKLGAAYDTLAHLALRADASTAGYDAGFEAGVLATEAGLGRYND